MNICFFGTYNAHYARTSTLREALDQNGINILELHEEIPNERMELPEDFTYQKTFHRIVRKIQVYIRLCLRAGRVRSSDAIIVLHPGHLDVPLARIIATVFRKPLFFDNSISPYDTMFIGRNIADRRSMRALFVKYTERFLLTLVDGIFVDTEKMKQFLAFEFGLSKRKIYVIPLGANNKIYKPSTKTSAKKNDIDVLFFGLYNRMHGAQYILQAAEFLKSYKNIGITMLGDGHLKPDFEAYVESHGLHNVLFTGFVPEPKLVERIQKADIVLGVFSDSPVFQRVIPNKVFAAIACKKTLVTAKSSAMTEPFIHRKNVFLVESENPRKLADALITLSQDASLREKIASAGYETYNTYFHPKAIGETFVEMIRRRSI